MADADKKEDITPEALAAAEAAAAAAHAKKKKLMMIAAIVITFLVIGGGAGLLLLTHKSSGGEDSGRSKTEIANINKNGDDKKAAVYYSLGDLLVNLSGEGKHPNYLKVKISLELVDDKDLPLMDSIKPRIVDNFQVYLRELRIEDLRGSAGMYRLREELLMRVTEAAQPVRIRDVLFQEMLVQ